MLALEAQGSVEIVDAQQRPLKEGVRQRVLIAELAAGPLALSRQRQSPPRLPGPGAEADQRPEAVLERVEPAGLAAVRGIGEQRRPRQVRIRLLPHQLSRLLDRDLGQRAPALLRFQLLDHGRDTPEVLARDAEDSTGVPAS